jgi:hypothetical protein
MLYSKENLNSNEDIAFPCQTDLTIGSEYCTIFPSQLNQRHFSRLWIADVLSRCTPILPPVSDECKETMRSVVDLLCRNLAGVLCHCSSCHTLNKLKGVEVILL